MTLDGWKRDRRDSVFGLLVVAFALAAIRGFMVVGVPPRPASLLLSYEAAAHVFVGGLFVAWRYTRDRRRLWLFVALCVIEVVAAIASRVFESTINGG